MEKGRPYCLSLLLVQTHQQQVLRPVVLNTKSHLPLLFLAEIREEALPKLSNPTIFSVPEKKQRYFFLNNSL